MTETQPRKRAAASEVVAGLLVSIMRHDAVADDIYLFFYVYDADKSSMKETPSLNMAATAGDFSVPFFVLCVPFQLHGRE